VSPELLSVILEGVLKFGPVFLELIAAVMRREDPVEVLARKRVDDIVPDPLQSELVLAAKQAAMALEDEMASRGRHAEALRREA
jgi:hypothetical protein